MKSKQGQNNFDIYWERKYARIKTTFPDMSEKDLKIHMIRGLKPELRTKLLEKLSTNECPTIEDLRDLAKKLYEVSQLTSIQGNSKHKVKYENNALVEPQTDEESDDDYIEDEVPNIENPEEEYSDIEENEDSYPDNEEDEYPDEDYANDYYPKNNNSEKVPDDEESEDYTE